MTAPCPTCGGGGSVREGTKRDDTPWIDCPDCHDGYVTEAEARRILAKRTERGSWGTTPLARRLDHFGLTPAEADALAACPTCAGTGQVSEGLARSYRNHHTPRAGAADPRTGRTEMASLTTITTVTGASDDLIELEGHICEEFDSYDADSRLGFDNGAVVVLHYGDDGIWRITDRSTTQGFVTIIRCENRLGYDGPDGSVYSDEATIVGAKSVKHRTARA